MSERPDFSLESDWLEPVTAADPMDQPSRADAAAGAKPPEPVVVIQYRNRGIPPILLFPIALVGSLALFAGYHYFVAEPMAAREVEIAATRLAAAAVPNATPSAPDLDAAISQVTAVLGPSVPDLPSPLTLEGQPAPLGLDLSPNPSSRPLEPSFAPANGGGASAPPVERITKEDQAAAEKPAAPEVRERSAPISIASTGPAPHAAPAEAPRAEAVTAPQPPAEAPTPTREEMMERIRQEAELQQAKQDELQRRKEEAVAQFESENVERVENERVQFHEALSDIVSGGRRDAGQAIDDLCDRFGRGYSQELKDRVFSALAHYKGKLTREGEIRMLRTIGVPEPGILDYLCNRAHRSVNSRNGPNGPDEVRLVAAKQLLRVQPGAAGKTAPAGAAPSRPSSIRRTNSGPRP